MDFGGHNGRHRSRVGLIEEDHGFAVAKGVAQHLVVYHRRHGGQSQFAASVDLAPQNNRITAALATRRHRFEASTMRLSV